MPTKRPTHREKDAQEKTIIYAQEMIQGLPKVIFSLFTYLAKARVDLFTTFELVTYLLDLAFYLIFFICLNKFDSLIPNCLSLAWLSVHVLTADFL